MAECRYQNGQDLRPIGVGPHDRRPGEVKSPVGVGRDGFQAAVAGARGNNGPRSLTAPVRVRQAGEAVGFQPHDLTPKRLRPRHHGRVVCPAQRGGGDEGSFSGPGARGAGTGCGHPSFPGLEPGYAL